MGDRVTWFEDCPQCKGKNTVENYEQLSANMKIEYCIECDNRVNWEGEDSNDVIEISRVDEQR